MRLELKCLAGEIPGQLRPSTVCRNPALPALTCMGEDVHGLSALPGAAIEDPASQPSYAQDMIAEASLVEERGVDTAHDGWNLPHFLSGIEVEDDKPAHVIAGALSAARPREFVDDLVWCKHLAADRAKLGELLAAPSLIDGLVEALSRQMSALAEQAAATSKELNDKFVADSGAELSFGERRLFDDGLVAWIGVPNQAEPMEEMWCEHNEYPSAREAFCAGNYGVDTDPIKEWIAAAGEWTPMNRSHAIKDGFSVPRETRNIEPEHMRRMICLDEFTRAPDEAEMQEWEAEGEQDRARLSQQELARRRVLAAGLLDVEVLALRLWSGPMYYPYNAVLRSGTHGQFTTTLHVLVSAIIKLARIGTPEVVYRGLSGRSIVLDDFERGFFVEKGAQSFTRDKSVALKYASWGREGAASYLVEVREGWADQGADISAFSYYPYEKEKLYGPLVLMQLMDSSVDRRTLKLKMRLNINLHDGTLDEAMAARKRFIVSRQKFLRHSCEQGWAAIKSALLLDKAQRPQQTDGFVQEINSALRESGVPLQHLNSELFQIQNLGTEKGEFLQDAERIFEERKAKEESLFASMSLHLEKQPAEWFNDDANFKAAVTDSIDFRKHSISRILMSVLEDRRRHADSAEKAICQPKVKDVCFIHRDLYSCLDGGLALGDAINKDEPDAAISAEEPADVATIACEPCDSRYPLYEVHQAGLSNVAQCMQQLKVGYRRVEIAQAEAEVSEERRERHWDVVNARITLVLFMAFLVIVGLWGFDRQGPEDGWRLVILFFIRVIPEVWTSPLMIWVLKTPAPTAFVPFAIWRLRKSMGLWTLPLSYFIFQSWRMWHRTRFSSGYDWMEFPFGYDWMEFPLWFSLWIPIVDFPCVLALRQISLTQVAQRWVPGLMTCYPALFCAVYPVGFYVLWIGLYCGIWGSHDSCVWPAGRLNQSTLNHSLGWILVCSWCTALVALIAVRLRRRHQHGATARRILAE